MHGLSCPSAHGIGVPWPGIEPTSPALQGRFLSTGPPGTSPRAHLLSHPDFSTCDSRLVRDSSQPSVEHPGLIFSPYSVSRQEVKPASCTSHILIAYSPPHSQPFHGLASAGACSPGFSCHSGLSHLTVFGTEVSCLADATRVWPGYLLKYDVAMTFCSLKGR